MESLLSNAPAQPCAGDGLRIFAYSDSMVRTVEVGGEPWFVAKDVAEILEYKHTPDMMRMLDDDEKGVQIMHTPGGEQQMSIISESGLYHAIFQSRKDEAKAFRRWVTGEVLPQVRRTGAYGDGGARRLEAFARSWDTVARTLEQLVNGYEAGLIGADTGTSMALATFQAVGADVGEAWRRAREMDDKGLTASVGMFFKARIRFNDAGAMTSSRELYETWCEWAREDGVSRRAFTARVRRLFPSVAYKQLRLAPDGSPEPVFIGLRIAKVGERSLIEKGGEPQAIEDKTEQGESNDDGANGTGGEA